MNAYDRVQAARAKGRQTTLDFIHSLFTDFVEMHGDRRFGDDHAIVTGIALMGDMPVSIVGIEKGHDTSERVRRNFGSAQPEGYRKAIRQFRQAEKFRRPVICFVDTSGAYCGIGAEERGQGQAIAESMATLAALRTPVISIVIGEGGSGGALALAVADEVWMLENSIYSVISPEGAASIIWKDAKRVKEASNVLRLTAEDLMQLGVIERIIGESGGSDAINSALRQALSETLARLTALSDEELLKGRYDKFRRIGGFPT